MTVEHMAPAMSLAAQGIEGIDAIAGISAITPKAQLATCSLTPPLRRNMNLYFHAWRVPQSARHSAL